MALNPGRTKSKYNIGYAITSHVQADNKHALCLRLHVNGKTIYRPSIYKITKEQWGNKDMSGVEPELREEILAHLEQEIEIVKARLDAIPEDELYAMNTQEVYQYAFQKKPYSRGGLKEDNSSMRRITYALCIKPSTRDYINQVAKKCGYTTATTFLNEAIFATMAGVTKATDLNPMAVKAEYMRYLRDPQKYIDILRGKIEEPQKPNKKRYKYDLGFENV